MTGIIWRVRWPGSAAGAAVLVGIGLFVVPAVLTGLARAWVDDATPVALFSLTPLFAVVLEPHLGPGPEQVPEVRGSFPAALVAVAGTLLVFPVDLPHSYPSAFALTGVLIAAAAIAAANCCGVAELRKVDSSSLTFTAVATGSASLLLGLLGLLIRQNESITGHLDLWIIPDLVALALTFWLMGQMSAVQMTTRFLIAPLLANLISLMFLRPHIHIQTWIGLLMIAVGSGWMLWAPAKPSDSSLQQLLSK